MSRSGRIPVALPQGVQVKFDGQKLFVSGPKGKLEEAVVSPLIKIEIEGSFAKVSRTADTNEAKALHGLYRSLLQNMVTGVSTGFEKVLQFVGVGYKAVKEGNKIVLQLGHSHPIEIDPPAGITLEVEAGTKVKVLGADKEIVGQVARKIKYCRPVEPYKGKGVMYAGEYVRRKAGKAAKGAAGGAA